MMVEYNKDLVVAKVKQCFPNENQAEIMAILDLYGRESYEQERERVQVAILKLSNGDLGKLHENLDVAKSDYRDVLASAEYPEAMSKHTWKMGNTKEMRIIRERDRQQYLNWLNS